MSISKLKSYIVLSFSELLADNGDMFFSSGSVDEDYALIVGTIESQGYWAGTKLRYFFDKEFNLLRVEEREFGT